MSRKQIIIALVVLIAAIGGGAAWYFLKKPAADAASEQAAAPEQAAPAPAAASNGKLPDPVVLVLNRGAILQFSKASQDINRQVQVFADQARNELGGQGRALEAEADQIRNDTAMTADARQKRATAFAAKQAAFQATAQRREKQINDTLTAARAQISTVMGPLVQQMVKDRHANIVLDKEVVVFETGPAFDISADVIKALDAKMTTVKVTLAPIK